LKPEKMKDPVEATRKKDTGNWKGSNNVLYRKLGRYVKDRH
jgi:hypothetical protein